MDFVNLTIDGQKIRAARGETLVEAARRGKIDIPTLCYDKHLEVVSSCRLCIVEIEGRRGFPTACSTPVEEGLVVTTDSPQIQAMRQEILQLLLDNHPNDCLTCQAAGECSLQKYSYRYGVHFRDHQGARRGSAQASYTDTSSPYILRDEAKCILCGKCIRTCAQVETRQVLSFAGRGFDSRVVADQDQSLEASTCVSCNRCVSVCPVGALVDRRAQGKVRPFLAQKRTVKCKACDYGCNMELLMEDGRAKAVRAKEAFNGRPLCLKGRLFTEANLVASPDRPYVKTLAGGQRVFEETSWMKMLELEGVYGLLAQEEGERK